MDYNRVALATGTPAPNYRIMPSIAARQLLGWCILSLLCSVQAHAQHRLDFGLHFTPNLRYVASQAIEAQPTSRQTVGGNGWAVGYGIGGNLEYRIIGELYGRVGVDYFRHRHRYAVDYLPGGEQQAIASESRVVYNAIEVPVQLLYRFDFPSSVSSWSVGVGAVVGRWTGDPRVLSPYSDADLTGFSSVRPANYSLSATVGYDRYLGRKLLVGLEPYVSYTPTRIELESDTQARVSVELGVRMRVTVDN